jgi:hypothetical protein
MLHRNKASWRPIMAKPAATVPANSPAAAASAPSLPANPLGTLPGIEALVSLQKANLETAVQIQKILADAAQSGWQLYLQRLEAWQSQAQGTIKTFDPKKKPEAYAAEAQTAIKAALADAKATVEQGVGVQKQVSDLLAQRFVANLNGFKALAA